MNAFLNYVVEANLGLCLMLLMYALFLRRDTDFGVKRFFLLVSIACSILFPLIQIDGVNSDYVPSLGQIIPTSWLPEVVITAEGSAGNSISDVSLWDIISGVYSIGVCTGLILFVVRVFMIARTLLPLRSYRLGDYLIFESNDNQSSFSFFRCIYIGQASELSTDEKAMIIHHEQIHASRLHSFDILFINVVGVFFWFNPVIGIYKKILIQLHEFEADARSVSSRDVDNYCSLLAKVALMSADIKLANHFSNSLTVKRIEMMRTIKARIKRWKYIAYATVLPSFFFVVACQDQVVNDMTDVAKNTSTALLAPEHVQQRFDEMKRANPTSNVQLFEINNEGSKKLWALQQEYGAPKSAIYFTPEGAPEAKGNGPKMEPSGNDRMYVIIEYDANARKIAELSKSEEDVYQMVDTPAEFPGGLEALKEFLQSNLVYPDEARTAGLEGTEFVSFIVEKDGSVSSITSVSSFSAVTQAAAVQVVQNFPKWIPGKNEGQVVRSRFVVPIKFKLG